MVMMMGVGGFQLVASHRIVAFTLGIDPAPADVQWIGTPAGSALSMCGLPSERADTSGITVQASSWRHSTNTSSEHSPPGLVSACN